jgi:glutamyl-tRNA synthetase
MVRTRIAPSPTGYPHIGTMYQALFDYAFARKNNGKFIVRIEDTDRSRFVEDAEDKLFEAFDWFHLVEDESPRKGGNFGSYKQSERLSKYHKFAEDLIRIGGAEFVYYRKEDAGEKDHSARENLDVQISDIIHEEAPSSIDEMIARENWVLKLKVPRDQKIVVKDELRGEISFESNEVDSAVLIKSDGYPTYHFAVVVDDHEMNVTHVVRGEEWISSFPKHKLIYDYFNWNLPLFFHTPVLRNPDKSKLSKRHGHTNVSWYKNEGYLPEAILNFLALLGWSHPEEKEIFKLDEFISLFELKDLKPIAPIFDLKKLEWMNGEYIRSMDVAELAKRIRDYSYSQQINQLLDNSFFQDKESLEKVVALSQERISTLKDFYDVAAHFFIEPSLVATNTNELHVAKDLLVKLENLTEWNRENIFSKFKDVMESYRIRMPLLYKIFTGTERGLPLPESLAILGKERTLKRLSRMVSL